VAALVRPDDVDVLTVGQARFEADRRRHTYHPTMGFRRRIEGRLPNVRCRPTTNPILPVDDLVAAIEFYTRLGFDVNAYDDGYAWVVHCGFEWFHLRHVDSVDGNHASAYLHVDDAHAWRAAMVAASGASIEIAEVVDTPWGKSEFSITDPARNLVRIGSDI
jgi:catechol 2,3-dioxygenase-like lactoylglutathione lyase family enzyme